MSSIAFIVMFMFGFQLEAKEQRVALVIGNASYIKYPLANPVNDATDMANKLRDLGFDVVERNNIEMKQIGSTLSEFRSKIKASSVALVFYAGHGVQIKGENYLPTIDADINVEEDVPNQSIAVKQILDILDESKTRLNLVFLDACRNNPYSRSFRSATTGGLARVVAPSGTLISYATRPGSVAEDGDGRNGLYTSKLLKQLDSNQPIELSLKTVVREVKAASFGKQEPWMEGGIEGEFCFAGCTPVSLVSQTIYQPPKSNPHSIAESATPVPTQTTDIAKYTPSPAVTDIPFTEPEVVAIKGGCFQMGSPTDEDERRSNEKQHKVCLKNFEIGKYEVTQAQWQSVMGYNPSHFKGNSLPVEQVSWHDVQGFIESLNAKTGKNYRLPTEAEWEYVARAGTSTPFYTGDCINANQANYDGNHEYVGCEAKGATTKGQTKEVGAYSPNKWGVYDMIGNVWEWTCSAYVANYNGSELKCSSKDASTERVARGGSWNDNLSNLRSAYRGGIVADDRSASLGFRLLRM